MNWAIEKYVDLSRAVPFLRYCKMAYRLEVAKLHNRNEYLNSKPGRIHDAEESAEARQGGSVRG